MIEAAINGMLASLDPHSSYMNAKQFEDMSVQTRGEFGGLGIEVTMENGVVKVVSPIDDTPASRAGIMANDLIIKIDGTDIQGTDAERSGGQDARQGGHAHHRSPSSATRQDPFDQKLMRDRIRVQSVKYNRRERRYRLHPHQLLHGADAGRPREGHGCTSTRRLATR